MLTDLWLAIRAIRTRPGFTLAVVLCIALGIGINTTVYSLVHAVMLRALPYAEPDDLVAVRQLQVAQGRVQDSNSLPNFADLRDESRTLSAMAAFTVRTVNITQGAEPAGVDAGLVTGRFFDVLGVRPQLGRTFTAAEASAGAERTVVIGHALWRRQFDGDPGVVGRTLRIDGVPRTVIGVMDEQFAFTNDVEQLWLPIDADAPGLERGGFSYRIVGRLAPGTSVSQADAELRAIGQRLAERHSQTNAGWTVQAHPLQAERLPPQLRLTMLVMLGAVTFVLLVACANVANLMLSRTVARTHEMAIRTALGASRLRVARQLLAESVLLAVLGGALGVVLAMWGVQATLAALPFRLPPSIEPTIDLPVLVYTAVIAVAAGIVFGLAPALQAGRIDPHTVLKDGTRGSSAGAQRGRLRDMLVAAQLSLSLVLLAGAALMMQSFLRLQEVHPGFEANDVLAVQVYAGGDGFTELTRRLGAMNELRERLAALPGVVHVAALPHAPLSGYNSSSSFEIDAQATPPGQRRVAETRAVLGDYFATLRIPMLAGRPFTLTEALDTASRVVVISEGMAARVWPDGPALGRRISFGDDAWHTVVGVVPDVQQRRLGVEPTHQAYLPYAATASRTMTFLLRTSGDPVLLASAARRAVGAVDASLALLEVAPLPAIIDRSLWEQRLFGGLFGSFAAAALLLASVGLYGVIAYAASQRVHEMGIRIALGASAADIYRLVLGHGARVIAVSLLVGLALSLALTRVMASMLYGVSVADVGVFAGVTALLAAVAMFATYLPARRAARVDPVIALRAE